MDNEMQMERYDDNGSNPNQYKDIADEKIDDFMIINE